MAFDKLNLLKAQLERLPASLPNPPTQQSLYQWQLDQDFLSDEGIVAAMNQMLERVMGMRANGITIHEHGQGISSVVEVLSAALQEEPDNAIIDKWIDDITEAGRHLCPGENISSTIDVDQAPGPAIPAAQPTQKEPSLSVAIGVAHKKSTLKKATHKIKENMPKTTPPAKKTPSQPALKPSIPAPSSDLFSRPEDVVDSDYDPKTDITYDDPCYLDLTEPEINRCKGGGIPDGDMLAATVYCKALQGSDVGKEFVRCLGSFKCNGLWVWPRHKDRIMKHISTCQHIPASLRQSSSKKQGDKAPAAMLEKRKAEEDEVDKQTDRKASKKHRSGVGVVEKGENSPSLVLDLTRDAGWKELKEILDNDVVMLICVAGLPPRIANLPQWRTLLNHATRGMYKPASKDVLHDNHFPVTASWVRTKQMEY
ncbi:hypothetical protein FRC00_002164 [Tulasnella sp. 408]|nr:hypothetical protein FRC00_002164 [Tulasnella sp. 408]